MSKKEDLKQQILQLIREYYNEVHKTYLNQAGALSIMVVVTSTMKRW